MKIDINFQENALTSVQVFEHEVFGTLRLLIVDEQMTMFNLADACHALEIRNPRQVKSRLSKRGVITADTPTKNQHGTVVMQPMTYINEANLYRCIFQSRKAEAEKFQAWVFEEVLPQIRKTGGYIPTKNMRTGEALTESEVVEEATKIMQRTIAHENLPADDCFTATDVAKSLDMDVKEINHMLVSKGIMYWNGSRYKLTAKYSDSGYTKKRFFHYYAKNGEQKQRSYLVWTAKGKEFIKGMLDVKILK